MSGGPLPDGFSLVVLASVDSTNEEAKRSPRAPVRPRPTARRWPNPSGGRTAGRVDSARQSVLLDPVAPRGRCAKLPGCRVAIGEALAAGARGAPQIAQRRRLNGRGAGVLPNPGPPARPDWVVIGMGVNLAAYP